MKPNRLKRDLKAGKICIGTVLTIPSPTLADMASRCGFDWIWVDMEHTPLSYESVQTMLQAMTGSGVSTIVRVPWNDEVMIKRALDTGPDALIIPLVNTKEEAEYAVRAMKYPPVGVRGAGLGRAQAYGSQLEDYLAHANDELMLIVQIEHKTAVQNIEDICSVPGVDSIFLGPLDLSGSMGLLGQTNHPDVEAAMAKVLQAGKRANLPVGIMTLAADQASARIKEGYQNIGVGIDVDTLFSTWSAMVTGVERPAWLSTSSSGS
jgi:2-keto-3-deoxy-L-rhamnonate aldolase RhmA